MQQDNYVIECLVFVVHPEKAPDPEYQLSAVLDNVSGYVLLSEIAAEFREEILDFFASNGVSVIRSIQECPDGLTSSIRSRKVEIIHIILSLSLSSGVFIVYSCDTICCQILPALFRNRCSVEKHLNFLERQSSVFEETASLETIFHLVKFDPNISYRGVLGPKFLHFAVFGEYESLVRCLLINGADTEARNHLDQTALYLAVDHPSDSITKLLVEHGADTNAITANGTTPLIWYLHRCRKEFLSIATMKCLLDNGAKVDAHDDSGRSVLELAAIIGPKFLACVLDRRPKLDDCHNKCVLRKFLIELAEFFPCVKEENAVKINNCIDQLLAYGFDIDQEAAEDVIVFIIAIKINNIEIVTRLLRSGSSPTDPDCMVTALHMAVKYSSDSMIRVLLGFGADINAKTSEGETALRLAVAVGSVEVVKFLLERGAKLADHPHLLLDAAAAFYVSKTPGCKKVTETVKLLIQFGADVNIGFKYITPLTSASEADNGEIMEILIRNGANLDVDNDRTLVDFYNAIAKNKFKAVLVYLQNCVDARGNMREVLIHGIRQREFQSLMVGGNTEGLYHDMLVFFLIFLDPCVNLEEVSILDTESLRLQEIGTKLLDYGFMSLKQIFSSENVRNYISRQIDLYENHRVVEVADSCCFCNNVISLFHADLTINSNFYLPDSQVSSILQRLLSSAGKKSRACKAELAGMKNTRIGSSVVSFHDILNSNFPQMVRFLRNDDIAEALKSDESYKNFPIYGGMISKRVRKALFRKMLLAEGLTIFNFLFASNPNLPFAIKDKIVSYLNNQQLLILLHACHLPSKAVSTFFLDSYNEKFGTYF